MKEFIEKLIERLEEKVAEYDIRIQRRNGACYYDESQNLKKLDERARGIEQAIEIVNQLAEEYNPSKSSSLAEQIADDLSAVLKEAKSMGCKEVKYFHHIPLENVEIVIKALREYKQDLNKDNQGWIPCSERLPEKDMMVIGCLKDGTVQQFAYTNKVFISVHKYTTDDVIAWQPLPEPYKSETQKEIPTKHYEERFNRVV